VRFFTVEIESLIWYINRNIANIRSTAERRKKSITGQEISIIEPLLLLVNSSEVDWFRQCLEEDRILSYRLFDDKGVYIAYKDDSGYSLVFSFRDVVRDYTIATCLENEIRKLLTLKTADGKLIVTHDTKQLYLQQFLFKKPHRGLEYQLERTEIPEEPLNELELRPIKPENADRYFEVHNNAFEEQDIRADEPGSPRAEAYRWFTECFLSEKVDFYGYWIGEEIVGYALFDRDLLEYLVINPAFQNKGYGKRILRDSLRRRFSETDRNSIHLYTYLINLHAQALYESVGFRVVGEFTINRAE